jgi:protein-tyrosine kinase
MSRVFEALQQVNLGAGEEVPAEPYPIGDSSQLLSELGGEVMKLDAARQFVLPSTPATRLIARSEPHTLAAEKLRGLAARLRQARSPRACKRILIASAVRGDGKSMMSANLAITFASQGERTLLIDGDLHKPTLHPLLSISDRRGFSDWTESSASITDFLLREQRLPLWVLPAGNPVDQPLAKIQLPATKDLLEKLSSWFDWIVIDSPPMLPLADSGVWATMCDSILLVVREAVTPKKALLKTLDSIEKAKLFAVVLNDAYSNESKYYRQYYSGAVGQSSKVDITR